MRLTIRTRLVVWLFLAILPIMAAGTLFARQANNTVTERSERNLQNLLHLEIVRINHVLDTQHSAVDRVANRPNFAKAIEALANNNQTAAISDVVEAELRIAQSVGQQIEELKVVDRSGTQLGATSGFSWEPADASLITSAMTSEQPLVGDAFVTSGGQQRVGLVVPIIKSDGTVIGAMIAENPLAPVIELTQSLEAFGETSEALIIQRTSPSAGIAITDRRFDSAEAFTTTVDGLGETPSAESLRAPTSRVVSASDYRGAQTVAAVEYLERANWGVVVKIDQSEALAVADGLNRFATIALLLTLGVVLLAWLLQVRPLGSRLRETAEAANRVAGGDYASVIGDTSGDEIGNLARGIDRLAHDLSTDIAARELAEERLRYQANHDALTGLKNRQHAEAAIAALDANLGAVFSALFIDLDGFKEINDTHGHGIGDEVLVVLSRRLASALPDDTLVARWGGDEFLVILAAVGEEETSEMANRLTRVFRDPVTTRQGQHVLGASVGFALSSDHGSAAEVVLAADTDMFRAKNSQRSSRTVSPEAIRLVEAALSEDRVEVFFQPIVNFNETEEVSILGAEALVRIKSTDGSLIPPLEFLPALGSNELAVALDARVMEIAFRTVSSWHRQHIVPAHFRVSLNAGPATLNDATVVERMAKAMELHGVHPDWVVIEIPETVESVDPHTLSQFRELGVGLAIDDVGVAYSNLERMVDLDVDVAKLDRRWIPDVTTSRHSKFDVLQGLVEQCRSLNLIVCAEGVETEEQVQMLLDLGVTIFQGYFFGRPVASFDFERSWCSNFDTSTAPVSDQTT